MSYARKRAIAVRSSAVVWRVGRGWVDAVTADYPTLPPQENWPEHMIGDIPIKTSLRETYAKICHQVRRNGQDDREARGALLWCRANGNPHRKGKRA